MNIISLLAVSLITLFLLRIGYNVLYLGHKATRTDVLLLFLLACFYLLVSLQNVQEGWQSYEIAPYDYVSTGADPLYYYNRPLFRKPYMWPQRYVSSYPYPHDEPRP
jgi:hypothetical protein